MLLNSEIKYVMVVLTHDHIYWLQFANIILSIFRWHIGLDGCLAPLCMVYSWNSLLPSGSIVKRRYEFYVFTMFEAKGMILALPNSYYMRTILLFAYTDKTIYDEKRSDNRTLCYLYHFWHDSVALFTTSHLYRLTVYLLYMVYM